jgi:hypothetical protein
LAGDAQIAGAGGSIVDGMSLGDNFIIYSETAITVLTPTNDEFVWQASPLSNTVGAVAPNCIADLGDKHMVLTRGDIVFVDGRSVWSAIGDKFKVSLRNIFDYLQYDESYVAINNSNSEVWFCFPNTYAGYISAALVYNWITDSWTIVPMNANPRIAEGPYSSAPKTWTTWAGTWSDGDGTWSSTEANSFAPTMFYLNSDSSLNYQSPSQGPDAEASSSIERLSLVLEGQSVVTTITRLYPHMEGTQPVYISVGSQPYADGPVSWKPDVMFTPGVDRKVDIRSTGELQCIRISSTGTGWWRLRGLDVEYAIAGAR